MGSPGVARALIMAASDRGPARGLRAGALGLLDLVVMAVAGSAPTYSIAASTAALVAAVGLAGPAALLWCGIPMLGIALAYSYLNRIESNAGASYAWAGRVLHPVLGFLSGWSLVASATIFMVAACLPAGSATLGLFSGRLAATTPLVILTASAWFAAMVALAILGVRLTVRAQWIMSGTEIGILLLFAVLSLYHAAAHPLVAFSWSWLGFSRFTGLGGFAAGALVATFYYWGWDVSSNLGEETRDSQRNVGLAGISGVLIIFALFEAFTIAVNMSLAPATVQARAGDILAVLGQDAWPGPGGKLLVIAVMLSTIGNLQTTLIQVTRTMLAMARERTLPACLAWTLPKRRTPWLATMVVAVIALGLFIGSNYIGALSSILSDAIAAIGLQITVYYGLAGLTVVVAFRKLLFKSARNFLLMGLWPLTGALFLFWVLGESIPAHAGIVDATGLGALALGVIPLVVYWVRGSAYFRQKPTLGRVPPGTAVAVSSTPAERPPGHASPSPRNRPKAIRSAPGQHYRGNRKRRFAGPLISAARHFRPG
jgi:amino acid transporter